MGTSDFPPNIPPNKPLRSRRVVRFSDSVESLSEKGSETYDAGAEWVTQEEEVLPSCVHGHAIRSIQELGGRCVICRAVLCAACAQVRCELDGNIACGVHTERVNGRTVCSNHSFLRFLTLAWLPLKE